MGTVLGMKPEALFPLGESELQELRPYGIEKTFAKGDPIWQESDVPESIYILKSGRVHMGIESHEGVSSIVHFCTRAQSFCPAAAISGKPVPCSAIAATQVKVLAVPRSRFLALFNQLPKLARDLMKQMAPLMCESHCRQAISAAPVKDRLASLLGDLHLRYQGRELPFTRQELARMSGTTVETAIRTLSLWEKSGVIQSSRGSILIRQPEALQVAA